MVANLRKSLAEKQALSAGSTSTDALNFQVDEERASAQEVENLQRALKIKEKEVARATTSMDELTDHLG